MLNSFLKLYELSVGIWWSRNQAIYKDETGDSTQKKHS